MNGLKKIGVLRRNKMFKLSKLLLEQKVRPMKGIVLHTPDSVDFIPLDDEYFQIILRTIKKSSEDLSKAKLGRLFIPFSKDTLVTGDGKQHFYEYVIDMDHLEPKKFAPNALIIDVLEAVKEKGKEIETRKKGISVDILVNLDVYKYIIAKLLGAGELKVPPIIFRAVLVAWFPEYAISFRPNTVKSNFEETVNRGTITKGKKKHKGLFHGVELEKEGELYALGYLYPGGKEEGIPQGFVGITEPSWFYSIRFDPYFEEQEIAELFDTLEKRLRKEKAKPTSPEKPIPSEKPPEKTMPSEKPPEKSTNHYPGNHFPKNQQPGG
jgi:hypothetical protein